MHNKRTVNNKRVLLDTYIIAVGGSIELWCAKTACKQYLIILVVITVVGVCT